MVSKSNCSQFSWSTNYFLNRGIAIFFDQFNFKNLAGKEAFSRNQLTSAGVLLLNDRFSESKAGVRSQKVLQNSYKYQLF